MSAPTEQEHESNPQVTNESNPAAAASEHDITKDSWMLSPCEIYWEQYKECTSVRGKFHQYFIHGQLEECGQWKSDYDNCMKWKKKENKDALGEVLGNERRRLGDRLRASYANDVWELRDGPPATWAAPLPAWLQRENENTYLAVKCEQRHRDGDAAAAAAAARFAEPSRCTIL